MNVLDYSSYLRVEALLDLPSPLTRPDESVTHAAEHFFIVAHQASELWLSQVLLDLRTATEALRDGRHAHAAEAIERCAVVTDLMVRHLDVLSTLSPARFAEFRHRLGTASGSQSSQFQALDRELGMEGGCPSPLFEAFEGERGRVGIELDAFFTPETQELELARVAAAMLDLSRRVWKWRVTHVELVVRILGTSERGTGHTSGAQFLAGRLDMPFPPLWESVSRVHRAR